MVYYLGAYKGAMAENMVAVALRNKHKSLYYYREKTGSPEIDFVTAINNKLTIIETKASNGASTSFNFVLTHPNRFGKLDGIKLINGNIGIANAFVSFPLYALELMK